MRDTKPVGRDYPLPPIESLEITDEKFKELAEQTLKTIQDCDLGKESMCPVLFVHARPWTENNQLGDIETVAMVIAQDFNDAETKAKVMAGCGAKLVSEHLVPIVVFMASEAWMSHKLDRPPSEDEERKECIILAGKTILKDCNYAAMIPIKRDEKNNMIQDGEITTTDTITTPLLNHFFTGYFMAALGKTQQT